MKRFTLLRNMFLISLAGLISNSAFAEPKMIDGTHLIPRVSAPQRQLADSPQSPQDPADKPEKAEPTPSIGEETVFFTRDFTTKKSATTTAVLKAVGEHCLIYLEKGREMSDSNIQKIQETFDTKIYPNNHLFFGSEWSPGIDDDTRVTLLYMDVVDGFGEGEPKKDTYTGGYFSANNELPKSVLPTSNEREMIILDINPSDPMKIGTLAHEFQHLIHWNYDPDEATWVDEGMACLAQIINKAGDQHWPSFVKNPDNNLCGWLSEGGVANYGQTFYFMFYVLRQYAKDAEAAGEISRRIVQSKERGIKGVVKALSENGNPVNFGSLFRNFNMACYLNDPSIENGIYSFKGRNIRKPLYLGILEPTQDASGTGLVFSATGTAKVWSSGAFLVDLGDISGSIKVSFTGSIQGRNSCRNYFTVGAALFDDELSLVKNPPQVKWLGMKANTAEEMLPFNAGKHNSMVVLLCNLGPDTDKDFLEQYYAQYSDPATYALKLEITPSSEIPPTISQGPAEKKGMSGRSLGSVLKKLANSNTDLNAQAAKKGATGSERRLSDVRDAEKTVFNSIRSSISLGKTDLLDGFLSFYQTATDGEKCRLAPLKKKVLESVRFEVIQNGNEALSGYLESNR